MAETSNSIAGRCLPAVLTAVSLACLFSACTPNRRVSSSTDALWFTRGRLIVGDDSAPIDNAAFLVEGDSFTWVGRANERDAPEGATRVDLTGKTVIPALIDGHNHIGLTNVRDGTTSKAKK